MVGALTVPRDFAVEDVHQIIGNLKTLTLLLDEGVEDTILRITKTEAGPVTAGDIAQLAAGVSIDEITPGQKIVLPGFEVPVARFFEE